MEQSNSPSSTQSPNTSQPVLQRKKPRNLLLIFILIGICLFSSIMIPRIPDYSKPGQGFPLLQSGISNYWGLAAFGVVRGMCSLRLKMVKFIRLI